MNLSINLTLGSPATDSASAPAIAAEDMSDQGFSLRLADELNERDLAPLMLPESSKTTDPALLEQIATRQQIAAEAETLTNKDGRVWQEDPSAGLTAVETTEEEVVETFAGDKPWLDIIEKAHSYSPVLQANKANSHNVAEIAVTESTAVAVDLKQDLQLSDVAMVSAEQSGQSGIARPQVVAQTDVAKPDSSNDAKAESKTESKAAAVTGLMTGSSKVDIGPAPGVQQSQLAGSSAASTVAASQGVTTEDIGPDVSANGKLLQSAANDPVSKIPSASVAVPVALTTATEPSKQFDLTTATDEPAITSGAAQRSTESAPVKMDQAELIAQETAEQPEIVAGSGNEKTSVDRSDKQALKITVESALPAAEQTATRQETERLAAGQQAVAVSAMQAGPVTANRPTGTQSTGTDKAPAANAFAVHLRAVNQTQQQQQPQTGAEQQPSQGQAKATAEAMAALNLTGPAVTAAPVFAQQLQQISEAAPAAGPIGHAITANAVTTPGNTTLQSARLTETPAWQAPLALTEPAAAQQIKDRVMVQIQHKLQTAEVQLHPEELGSMQIKLNLQQDQLSVQFVVQQGAAKEALEQQMPKLRELLEQQGIVLSEGQVEQRQSRSQQEQRSGRHGNHVGTESELAAVQTVQMKVSDRMVDFYA